MTDYQGTIILAGVTSFLAIVQIIIAHFLSKSISRKNEKLKAELLKEIEDHRFSNIVRKEQAERVAELFSKIRLYKSFELSKEDEEKQKLNQQIWALTLWLPTKILEEIYCLIDGDTGDYTNVLVQIREYLNEKEKVDFKLDKTKIKDFI